MGDLPDLPIPLVSPDLEDRAKELGIKYFIMAFSSFHVGTRGPIIPRSAIRKVQQHGFKHDGLFDFGGDMESSEVDMVPDPDTLIQLPWKPEFGWLICNAYLKGKPHQHCPRGALIRQIHRLRSLGYVMKTGFEAEFRLLHPDKLSVHDESDVSKDMFRDVHVEMKHSAFITRCLDYMEQLGWQPYMAERELVTAQYEMNYGYTEALQSADRYLFFKFLIKEMAREHGVRATFMPLLKLAGNEGAGPEFPQVSGLHINASLWSASDDVSVMADSAGHLGMTDVGGYFLAGIMKHVQALTAFACSTINSFKRLQAMPNFLNIEAWAVEHKMPPIRVVLEADVPSRFEFRLPDCAANPYVLQAAMIAASVDGMNNKLEPLEKQKVGDLFGKPKPEGIEDMPKTQEEALEKLEKDEVLTEALGKELTAAYVKVKRFVLEDYHKQITPLELNLVENY